MEDGAKQNKKYVSIFNLNDMKFIHELARNYPYPRRRRRETRFDSWNRALYPCLILTHSEGIFFRNIKHSKAENFVLCI